MNSYSTILFSHSYANKEGENKTNSRRKHSAKESQNGDDIRCKDWHQKGDIGDHT